MPRQWCIPSKIKPKLVWDDSGTGGKLRVEVSACELAEVDTRRRMAKVDGRYVHWVTPGYVGDRYSIIYYRSNGEVAPDRGAVFDGDGVSVLDVPDQPTFCAAEDSWFEAYRGGTGEYAPATRLALAEAAAKK